MTPDTLTHENDNIAADILKGADEIAAFLGEDRRSIYYMIGKSTLPTYRLGASIRARKSTLTAWIREQEAARGAA